MLIKYVRITDYTKTNKKILKIIVEIVCYSPFKDITINTTIKKYKIYQIAYIKYKCNRITIYVSCIF